MIEFERQNAQPSFLIMDPNHDHCLSLRATRDVTVDDLAGFDLVIQNMVCVDLLIVRTSQSVSPVPACWLLERLPCCCLAATHMASRHFSIVLCLDEPVAVAVVQPRQPVSRWDHT
jgi:hypothetical protein